MNKILFTLLLFFSTIVAKDLKPTFVYDASGSVTDMITNQNKLYVSTAASALDIFDLKTKKNIKTIKISQMKDFMGDTIDRKIYNVDVLNNKILFTAEAPHGKREVYIYQNDKLHIVVSANQNYLIAKSKFIDENNIVFVTLGNQMHLYNIETKKLKWMIDVKDPQATFNSTFADFTLNEKRDLAVVADESGDLKIVDIKKAKVIKLLAGKNLDKVFKVDFKNNKIITAGQDGRCVVYNLKTNYSYFIREKHWFLIYGAGLSPSGTLGAFSSDEENNVTIFNTDTKTKLYKLTNNLMTLTTILFINEDELFVGTDSNKFNYYKLK
jgi:WD40 repeat protein